MSVKKQITERFKSLGLRPTPEVVARFEQQINETVEAKTKEVNERREREIEKARKKAKGDIEKHLSTAVSKILTADNMIRTLARGGEKTTSEDSGVVSE